MFGVVGALSELWARPTVRQPIKPEDAADAGAAAAQHADGSKVCPHLLLGVTSSTELMIIIGGPFMMHILCVCVCVCVRSCIQQQSAAFEVKQVVVTST